MAVGVPNVEHELFAPVEWLGSELTTGEGDAAGPIGMPVPVAGVPGSLPSGDVALSGGMAAPMPTWANAGLPQKEVVTTAITSNGLMRFPQIRKDDRSLMTTFLVADRACHVSNAPLHPFCSNGASCSFFD